MDYDKSGANARKLKVVVSIWRSWAKTGDFSGFLDWIKNNFDFYNCANWANVLIILKYLQFTNYLSVVIYLIRIIMSLQILTSAHPIHARTAELALME